MHTPSYINENYMKKLKRDLSEKKIDKDEYDKKMYDYSFFMARALDMFSFYFEGPLYEVNKLKEIREELDNEQK